jgi:hypothetical protein
MIITDGHTHIYPCFDLDILVEAAFTNFTRVSTTGAHDVAAVMFLADSGRTDSFRELAALASGQETAEPPNARPWNVQPTNETTALKLDHHDHPDISLFIIAGYQVVTSEKLEVLGVGLQARPEEGEPLKKTVETILAAGGLAILPWGVGKWLGKRKGILDAYIREHSAANLFVGDNGNRPALWPEPALLKSPEKGSPQVVSGSDPLPLAGEESRVGRFGSIIHAVLDKEWPTKSIIASLSDQRARITPFGRPQSLIPFIRQQLKLRLS